MDKNQGKVIRELVQLQLADSFSDVGGGRDTPSPRGRTDGRAGVFYRQLTFPSCRTFSVAAESQSNLSSAFFASVDSQNGVGWYCAEEASAGFRHVEL